MNLKRVVLLSFTTVALFGQYKPGDQATLGFTKHSGQVYAFRDEETTKFTWPPNYVVPFGSTTLLDPFSGQTLRSFAFPDQGVTINLNSVSYQSLPPNIQGKVNIDSGCCTGNLYPLVQPPNMRIVIQGSVTVNTPAAGTSLKISSGSGYDTAMCGAESRTPINSSPTVSFQWDSGDCPDSSLSFNYTGFDKTTGVYTLGQGVTTGWNINIDVNGLAGGHTVWMTLNTAALYMPVIQNFPDVTVKVIRVTQTVQNSVNAVPLVAGKRTVVRGWAIPVSGTDPAENFQAVLHAYINGHELAGSPLAQDPHWWKNSTLSNSATYDDPDELSTLNFTLPLEWTQAGKITFAIEVTPQPGTPSSGASHTTSIDATFAAPARWPTPLTVYYWPVCFASPTAPAPPEACPDNHFYPAADSTLRQLLPVPEGGLIYRPLPVGAFYLDLGALKVSLDNDDELDKLMARVRRAFIMLYLGLGLENMDQLVMWAPAGPPGVAAQADAPYYKGGYGRVVVAFANVSKPTSETLAHEMGHNLNLRHTARHTQVPCDTSKDDPTTTWPYQDIDLHGFVWDWFKRGGGGSIGHGLGPAIGSDIMSYCFERQQFPSAWTFDYLFHANMKTPTDSYGPFGGMTVNENQPASLRRRAQSTTGGVKVLLAGGSVSKEGTQVQWQPVYSLPATTLPLVPSNPTGNHCLVFSVSSGPPTNYCFDLNFHDAINGADLTQDSFTFLVPAPDGLNRVSLMRNGQELGALTAGAAAPVVSWQNPVPGAVWQAVPQTLRWTASDPDGDPLSHMLLYSPDNGSTWLPLHTELTAPSFTFDAATIQGGNQVWFRVITSDGIHTSSADVGPITVNQTPVLGPLPDAIDFGKAAVGAPQAATLALTNTGSGYLSVTGLSVDSPAFAFQPVSLPLVLAPGSTYPVALVFSPSAAGPQSGHLTVTAGTGPVIPPVALNGTGTSAPEASVQVTPAKLDFGSLVAGKTADQSVNVRNSGQTVLNVKSVAVSGAGFLLPSTSGFALNPSGSQSVVVRFSPAAAGSFTGVLTVGTDDPSTPVVTLNLTGKATPANGGNPPAVQAGGILNAASLTNILARGSLGVIQGAGLAPAVVQAASLPWKTSLGGTSVKVGGVAAPLYYVSPTQLYFQVPYEVPAGSSASVVVTSGGAPGLAVDMALADYAVGVFAHAHNFTAIEPEVFHSARNQLVSTANPAAPGEVLVLYGTGIGKLNNPPATGAAALSAPPATAVNPLTVTVGGAPATVLFAGLAPGSAGLVQIRFQLPSTLPAGSSLPLAIQFPGGASPAVSLAVRSAVVAAPQLSPSTNSLAFGNVTVGQSADLALTITNSGTAALEVNSAAISGNGFSLVPPLSSFTLQPGGSLPITVRYAPTSAEPDSGALTIASNDTASPAIVTLSGTGVAGASPAPGAVVLSDSFNRADAGGCALGAADLSLGGLGSQYYLPINSLTGVSIASGVLQNNTLDYAGVQLTLTSACGGRGETLLQDLYMRVDLLVPASSAGVVQAGPYFRSRAAAPGDGIIGGASAGYWVALTSTGEVRLRGLNPNAVIATTGIPTSFNAAVFHKLETVARGASLQIWLDGARLTFTQNGGAVTTLELPATNGSNDGTAGIAFADEDNRGKAGGQKARNLVIALPGSGT